MNETKCETHSKEIFEIRTEFHEYKSTTNKRLDEILEAIKPQFTHAQITGFLLTLVGMLAGGMIYITDVKSDARDNTTRVSSVERDYENIDKKLDLLIKEVAGFKAKNN